MAIDVSIRIGGEAGQGIQSVSYIMGKIYTRQGYNVFINQDVESRIRGGHNYSQVRVKDEPVYTISNRIHLLIALDKRTIDQDLADLDEDGVMIFDGEKTGFTSGNPNHFSIPLDKMASETDKGKIMINTIATGAVFALMGCEEQPLLDYLVEEFSEKGKDIVEQNKRSASAGYRYVLEHFKGKHHCTIPPIHSEKKKLLLTGSHAMALGAICSGLKFYAGYPMSPATPIMEFIATVAADYNIILEPAEDEIAAINMVVGASFAGVRAMTATSGGGFCLMVEGVGLAGMTETPALIVVAQRAGPSTGLPTRTEQSDLRFVIHASHGEFPRAVFAPGSAEQAFYLMGKAFNLAERYQTPVIVLGDQHLNDSYFTVDQLDMSKITIERGNIIAAPEDSSDKEYKRYALHASGVSPRILPGQSEAVLYADSDEHTEEGHITESAQVRQQMVLKRMKKFEAIKNEMGSPEISPALKADVALLGWGSTYGAIKEAADLLNQEGLQTQMIHFSELYPFTTNPFSDHVADTVKIFAIENNYMGQFSDLFSSETKIPIFHKILKFDGRPFSPQEIVTQVKAKI